MNPTPADREGVEPMMDDNICSECGLTIAECNARTAGTMAAEKWLWEMEGWSRLEARNRARELFPDRPGTLTAHRPAAGEVDGLKREELAALLREALIGSPGSLIWMHGDDPLDCFRIDGPVDLLQVADYMLDASERGE